MMSGGFGWWWVGGLFMLGCMLLMVWMMAGHGHSSMGHGSAREAGHGSERRYTGSSDAQQILAERFARGEISEEEFEQRKRVLDRTPS